METIKFKELEERINSDLMKHRHKDLDEVLLALFALESDLPDH